jgi:hypothetical protein
LIGYKWVMITYPLPDTTVIKRRSDAMRYLKAFKRDMKTRAELIVSDVLAIEGELREPVAYVCDALAQGCAHFDGSHMRTDDRGLGHGMQVEHLDIDEDLLDVYIERFGEDTIEEAAHWLLRRLKGESSMLISWALGPIRFPDGKHSQVLQHRILFDLETRSFKAVLSHLEWGHPDCTQYLVDGGKRKGKRGPKGLRPVG